MFNQKIKFISLIALAVVLTFGLTISVQYLIAAWAPPQSSPPTMDEILPPIYNQSASGNVKAQINAGANQEALRLISDGAYSPLNIQNAGGSDIFRINQNGDIATSNTIYKDGSGNVIIQLGN